MKKSPVELNTTKKNSSQKIPRPMNCFMTYRVEKQQDIVNQCPGANHRDISKIVAKWWRELPAAEKEPYRIKAAKAKAEHLAKYPEYKFCPKKKASKTRPYKKRPDNEFTARDFENKHQLFSLYHDGKLPDPSTPRKFEDEREFLLDNIPTKKKTKTNKQNKKTTLEQDQYPSPASPFTGRPDDTDFSDKQQASNIQYFHHQSTGLLYPPTSVPSQSVYSASTSPYPSSPYSTGHHHSSEEPITTSSPVNYQLYPDHYGYGEPQPVYSYPVQYHYTDPNLYYGYNTADVFVDPSSYHPLDANGNSQPRVDSRFSVAPTLLTTPFYYQ